MDTDSMSKFFHFIGMLFPIIFGLFSTFSLFYNYFTSDLVKRKFFSSAYENALYSLSKFFFRLLISAFLNILFYAYVFMKSNLYWDDLISEIRKNHSSIFFWTILFLMSVAIFYIIIFFVQDTFNQLFPTPPKLKSSQFYVLSNELNMENLPSSVELRIVSRLKNDKLLFHYFYNNQNIRIILSESHLEGVNIFYKTPQSLHKKIISINKELDKKMIYHLILTSSLLLFAFALIAWILQDLTFFLITSSEILLAINIFFSPTILKKLKSLGKQINRKDE
ncbi:TPA: hypothetical protein IX405_000167 [Enterococcus faecium]|nr:hypothetical protein [Enterococcus faecium]